MANIHGTANHFGVGVRGDEITLLRHVYGAMSKDAALNLAAYLVLLADDKNEFEAILKAIRET